MKSQRNPPNEAGFDVQENIVFLEGSFSALGLLPGARPTGSGCGYRFEPKSEA